MSVSTTENGNEIELQDYYFRYCEFSLTHSFRGGVGRHHYTRCSISSTNHHRKRNVDVEKQNSTHDSFFSSSDAQILDINKNILIVKKNLS